MTEPASEEPPALDFWVVSDRVLFVSEDGVREESSALGVADGVIREVVEGHAARSGAVKERARRDGVPIYDEGKSPLVPGFVNAHTHLSMAPLRGITDQVRRSGNVITDTFFRLESHLTPADVRCFTKLGAYESLLHGVTEVWDHYYFGLEVARGLADVGLTGTVAPTLQDTAGPGKKSWEQQWEDTWTIADSAELRACHVRAAWGPHATDTVSDELFSKVADAARTSELWIHLHAAQTSEEVRVGATLGRPSVADFLHEHLGQNKVLVAHGLFFSRSDCARLANANWVLAFCPLSQLQFGFPGPWAPWIGEGGRWVVGTDCVASNDALDVQRELPLIAGSGALRTGFSVERDRILEGGEVEALHALDARRRTEIARSPIEPEALLPAAFGCPLGRAGRRPLTVGSVANFLILEPSHPAVYPRAALARSLAYGSTHGAIRWLCSGGRIMGRKHGLREELLNRPAFLALVDEAEKRRDELFERAQTTRAPSS